MPEIEDDVMICDVISESAAKITASDSVLLNKANEHITVTDSGYIYLTEAGKEIAEMIYERHEFLTDFLTGLGVSPEIASKDACRIEHVISPESFEAMKKKFK